MKPFLLALSLIFISCTNVKKQSPANANSEDTEFPVASLGEAGFHTDSVENLIDWISKAPQKDYRGLVVIKDNQLVIEEYYNSFWRNHIHDIRSAGKSITALLLGVAIQEGLVKHIDQDVYAFFPKEKYPTIHEDYKKIKLHHLLDMVSGLNADSDDSDTPGNAGQWIGDDEWVSYLLSIPLAHKPGEKWIYADINAVLIGAIIEERSGMSLRDFAQQKLFEPLGITEFYWYTNASNQTGGAGNLYLSTYDFAKLGLVIANKGKWMDQQIADHDYVNRLINEQSPAIGDYSPLADSYGSLWYKSQRDFGTGEVNYLFATGNGGNHLVVVPEKNMVIAMTAGAYGQWYPHRRAYAILGKVLNALE